MKHNTLIHACEYMASRAKPLSRTHDYRRGVRDVIGELAERTITDHPKLSTKLNAIHTALL